MPKGQKVWISKLAAYAFRLARELDKGSAISISEAEEMIDKNRVVSGIHERFGGGDASEAISEDEEGIMSQFFSTASAGEDFGIEKNGLALLLALAIEMMQNQERA